MSDRRERIRLSCSCSTARMSEIPVRSVGHSECKSERLALLSAWCISCVAHLSLDRVPCLPAETRTTAMKRAISSGSRAREPSFSLNSNMASSKEPMPKACSMGRGYVWPFRKVTVWCSALNKVQNLTIRTCGGVKRDEVKTTRARRRADGGCAALRRLALPGRCLIWAAWPGHVGWAPGIPGSPWQTPQPPSLQEWSTGRKIPISPDLNARVLTQARRWGGRPERGRKDEFHRQPHKSLHMTFVSYGLLTSTLDPGASFHGQDDWFGVFSALWKLL